MSILDGTQQKLFTEWVRKEKLETLPIQMLLIMRYAFNAGWATRPEIEPSLTGNGFHYVDPMERE